MPKRKLPKGVRVKVTPDKVTPLEPSARYITTCSHPGCRMTALYTVKLPGDRVVWKCLDHMATDHGLTLAGLSDVGPI